MPKAYSNDLRLLVVAAMQSGETCRAVAAGFDIAPSTAAKWFRRFKQSGSTAPAKIGGYLAPALDPHESWIRDQVRKCPEITVRELTRCCERDPQPCGRQERGLAVPETLRAQFQFQEDDPHRRRARPPRREAPP